MMRASTIELLALPAWNSPPRSLEDWKRALTEQGLAAAVSRTDDQTWLEVGSLGLRGFVCIEGNQIVAINFELRAADPEPASRSLDNAAQALGWEIHPDDPEEDDLDED